jgi:hypothetical protein
VTEATDRRLSRGSLHKLNPSYLSEKQANPQENLEAAASLGKRRERESEETGEWKKGNRESLLYRRGLLCFRKTAASSPLKRS